ncbi:MAG: hypothetical protein FWB85_10535 [Chitinispirillia bacterium]|nr:hypothetical protein [Chitinispirillia bacterium]MCL2242619.1 hypothetical protein [Chitinispirillia bacterium]
MRAYTAAIARIILLTAVFACAQPPVQPPPAQPQAQTRPQSSSPDGFNGAAWGSTVAQVQQAVGAQGWQPDPVAQSFPPEMGVTAFRANSTIAGYPATATYYFWRDRFFQATVRFPFANLENFDFNYNVYRSVSEYYSAIRAETLNFTYDIYALLRKKYGHKQPVFKGLDPRYAFSRLDAYLKQERWNLRYHPYEFYQRIVTASYARWDFPKTRVIFSINIAAPDKRFDYLLSAVSLDMDKAVQKELDSLKMRGL